MATLYLRSTDGSDADDGSTWALAKASIDSTDGIGSVDAAGDTIYVSGNHAESTAGAVVFSCAGTLALPSKIICVNDAAQPPTAVATTATMTTTGTSAWTLRGSFYMYGITFNTGTGGNAVSLIQADVDQDCQLYENCNFKLVASSASYVQIGTANSGVESKVTWKNCGLSFAAAANHLRPGMTEFKWEGGSLLAGTASPTALITPQSNHINVEISGVDLSQGAAGMNIVTANAAATGKVVLRNCKLPASWSGALGAPTGYFVRNEMHNCDSADTNYRMWIEDYAGSIKSETTIVRTGGASDGTTALAWKMVTSANAEYPIILLVSPEGALWNDTTGASKTLTVEIVHDSQGAGSGSKFQDDEVWLEVMALTTSGFPLGAWITDCKADVLAAAANQADSSETWTTTGLTTPVKQALSVTFTPQEKGVITWRVVCAKASKTLYVCPEATLT